MLRVLKRVHMPIWPALVALLLATRLTAGSAQEAVDARVARIEELVAGRLDPSVDPQSLFDLALSDEAALQLEAARLRVLLEAAELRPHAAPAQAAPVDAGAEVKASAIDDVRWRSRLALDRARLAFYSLSTERRRELLQSHQHRRQPVAQPEAQFARKAGEPARTGSSEEQRSLESELARLERRVEASRKAAEAAQLALTTRKSALSGWLTRARRAQRAGGSEADQTYAALRGTLESARAELSRALDALDAERTEGPAAPSLRLGDFAVSGADPEPLRERYAEVTEALRAARSQERALLRQSAQALLHEITSLDHARLALLAHVSEQTRRATHGFDAAAREQALTEAHHLALVLRYHEHVARTWLTSAEQDFRKGLTDWTSLARLVPWLGLLASFAWLRTRTPVFLGWLVQRFTEQDRAERRPWPSPQRRLAKFLLHIHRPVQALALIYAALWLLSPATRALLEVQLLALIATWNVGATLIVLVIDSLAAGMPGASLRAHVTGTLRLRSLRLLGRTSVAFALFLALSARLLGEGTIHGWIKSSWWLVAVPVFLVLMRWWRVPIFERIARSRRKTALEAWVLANRSGSKSLIAATLGASQLFGVGALKLLRQQLSRFELSRRVHAYLFRRELDRFDEAHRHEELQPLGEAAFAALHPEREVDGWLPCPADAIFEQLVARVRAGQGGVVGVTGARGMGKTSLLQRLQRQLPACSLLACRHDTDLAELRGIAASSSGAVLLDEAHALIKPVIGGLAAFDQSMQLAREDGRRLWVFAIDASVWPFLKRSRDGRPLFDDVFVLEAWSESQIGALLDARSTRAGIHPSYEGLLDKLPPGSDELDRADALAAKAVGYIRMLWDHVEGSPALALEAWRTSLAVDSAGQVHVRPLHAPDAAKLEPLPDTTLFVLRAVLQLTPASVEDVALATRLSREQVLNAFRFGQAQGFFSVEAGQARVSWHWLRAVVRLLARRHLLVMP